MGGNEIKVLMILGSVLAADREGCIYRTFRGVTLEDSRLDTPDMDAVAVSENLVVRLNGEAC